MSIFSFSRFLTIDIRKQQKYEKRIQTSVDNTVNNVCHEIEVENHKKNKNNCFIKQKIYFLLLNKKLFSWKIPRQILNVEILVIFDNHIPTMPQHYFLLCTAQQS